ncbi:MAG: rRNA maturation RNase YbeY [Proteobacteria bacterium]|nr:rRNA maturation RNase YbeY [Pseudomonadota bacterium]
MKVAVSEPDRAEVDEPELRTFAESVLAAEHVPSGASLSISFIDRDEIADMNLRFMGAEGATDVLSFPIEDAAPGSPPKAVPGGPPLELGDIFICADVVSDHADEYGVAYEDELFLMVVHGVLHILGWDHQTDADAEMMENREAKHLKTIGRTRR